MFERLFGPGAKSSLIDAAYRDVSEMLRQSAKMFDFAVAALLENQPLEVDLDKMDDTIDENERMVRRSVLEHLAIDPKHDLVASLVLVSMVQDAERIGDFARGMGELTALAKSPRQGPFCDALKEVVTQLRPLFQVGEESFLQDDAAKARHVMAEHQELKGRLRDFEARVADSDLSADMAVVYAGGARILRRISSHLSNIASSVVNPYDRIRSGDESI